MPSVDRTPTSRLRSDAARPSAQPASSPSAGGAGDDPDAPAPRLDGRRVHIVDRALDYVALAAGGLSAAKIARKRRRSAGYVSILLRLGRAIQGLEPAELAALRSPRVTWKLAQRVVRTDADVGSVRHQLRLALGGFSSYNVDRRKHRAKRAPAAEGAPAASASRSGAAWGWDESWFTRDPLDYVRHHLAHLAAVHRAVETRARRHATLHAARRLSVGQSLVALQRTLSAPGAGTSRAVEGAAASASAPSSRALAALGILERHLAAAQEEMASFLAAEAPMAPSPAGLSRPRRPAPAPLTSTVEAGEIDEDLE